MRTAEALGLTIALTCGGLMVIIKTVTHDSEIAALRARVSALEAEQRILRASALSQQRTLAGDAWPVDWREQASVLVLPLNLQP